MLSSLPLSARPCIGRLSISPLAKQARTQIPPRGVLRTGASVSLSTWTLTTSAAAKPPRLSVAVSASSSAASSGTPSDETDFFSQGLLRNLYPSAAVFLGVAGVLMLAAPSKFAERFLLSCPLPPPATAIQLAGASLALPAAACVALGKAAEVGPKRLSSATYVTLNAGVALFGLAAASSVSAATTASAAGLATSKLFSSLALFVPLVLALASSTAATAYGGPGVGGSGVARALAQAPVAVSAAIRRATSSAAAAAGTTGTAARLFGASSGALAVVSLAAAVSSSSADVTSALFLRVAASGALFASVAAAVLSDASSRGRSGASTFVKLKAGGVAGSAAAAGANVGGAVAAASSSSLSSLAPTLGVTAALLLFGGTCAWQLATVVGKK